MTTYYITGTIERADPEYARKVVDRAAVPAVIRRTDGGLYRVTQLSTEPRQPGQVPFKLHDGETVHYAPPSN